jgi:ABC-type lipoprotein export system ATPase subunit
LTKTVLFDCNFLYHRDINFIVEQGKNTLVVGEAGSGKSALLCNWISALQKDNSNHIVVYHFIGYADGSTGLQ